MHLRVSLSCLLYSFCISDWAGCTVSNGSAPLFPFLNSDWNNGMSISSKQVTVVCYLQYSSLKPRNWILSAVLQYNFFALHCSNKNVHISLWLHPDVLFFLNYSFIIQNTNFFFSTCFSLKYQLCLMRFLIKGEIRMENKWGICWPTISVFSFGRISMRNLIRNLHVEISTFRTYWDRF